MDVNELLKQGADAYRAGDGELAYKFFKQAAQTDPSNPKALYYLAGVEPDIERRRKILTKVLEIQPDHEKARELLDKLPPPADDDFSFDDMSTTASPTPSSASSGYVAPKTKNSEPGVFGIPGAPASLDPQNVISTFIEIFQHGVAILQRKEGSYPMAVQKGSWWRFVVYVGVIYVATSLLSTIASAITLSRLAASMGEFGSFIEVNRPTPINIVLNFIITIPLSIAAMYAGLYASHWWVTNNRNGQGSLMAHSYAMILPVATATIIYTAISLVLSFVPFIAFLASLATIVLFFYALYVSADGVVMVHKIEKSSAYWAIAVAVVAQIVVGLVLGLVLSPVLIGTSMF